MLTGDSICKTLAIVMQLTVQIAARIDPKLKGRLDKEVRRRRRRGEGIQASDVIRDALIKHFESKPEACSDGGKAVGK